MSNAQWYLDSALRKAAKQANVETVDELCERGCRQQPSLAHDVANRRVLRVLAEQHGLDVDYRDHNGSTPLMNAASMATRTCGVLADSR